MENFSDPLAQLKSRLAVNIDAYIEEVIAALHDECVRDLQEAKKLLIDDPDEQKQAAYEDNVTAAIADLEHRLGDKTFHHATQIRNIFTEYRSGIYAIEDDDRQIGR